MSKFSVGEVAIVVRTGFPRQVPVGSEVTITEVLPAHFLNQYLIDTGVPCPNGMQWGCRDEDIRKKYPPQDWTKLCKLDSVPKGEPMEIA